MAFEVPHTPSVEKDDIYKIQLSDLMKELNDIKPKELVRLFVSDHPLFLKKFVNYITSQDMEDKYANEIDRESYKHDMKAYFEKMDEKSMRSKNLPLPLIEGYKDLFVEGMKNPTFKKEIRETLNSYFTYKKDTDTYEGEIQGSDIGGSITGKVLILYKNLYNTRGVTSRS